MKEADGKFTHSRIVIVTRSSKGAFEIIPNRAGNNEIRIAWNNDNRG